MAPPLTNANLVKVLHASATTGGRDDWDEVSDLDPVDEVGGVQKWAGSLRVYYREVADRVEDGGTVNVTTRRTMYLETANVDTLTLDTNDVVELTTDDGVTFRGRASEITRRAAVAGVPAALVTTRVELERA